MNELRTPAAVAALEAAICDDLHTVRSLFEEGADRLEGLADALRVLPMSRASVNGWRAQAEDLCRAIGRESEAVAKKLAGGDAPPIESEVDPEHAARVVEFKRQA